MIGLRASAFSADLPGPARGRRSRSQTRGAWGAASPARAARMTSIDPAGRVIHFVPRERETIAAQHGCGCRVARWGLSDAPHGTAVADAETAADGRDPPARTADGLPGRTRPIRPTVPGRWIHRHFRGDQGAREYDVYLPSGLSPDRPDPVLLLLHGCQQRSLDFAVESGFVAAADTEGFLIVAPRQDRHHQLQRCWRWYESEHQGRGRGEPAILAGLVAGDECRGETVAGRPAPGLRGRAVGRGRDVPDPGHHLPGRDHGRRGAFGHRVPAARPRASARSARWPRTSSMPSTAMIRGEMAPVVLIHGTNDPGGAGAERGPHRRPVAGLTGLAAG